MTRISYRRASPENWEKTIKRMVALNNVDARAGRRARHPQVPRRPPRARARGSAPDRVRGRAPAWSTTPTPPTRTPRTPARRATRSARVLSERRTKEEWELLVDDAPRLLPARRQPADERRPGLPPHAAAADRAGRGRPSAGQPPPDGRALEHLTKTFPLNTPAWAAWSASMQPAKLAGKWAISGYQAGKGPIFGQVTVTADPSAPDGFTTETRYTVARTGETVDAHGQSGRLHRLPVARPRRRAGQRQRLARGR